jgi:hypothetical protein
MPANQPNLQAGSRNIQEDQGQSLLGVGYTPFSHFRAKNNHFQPKRLILNSQNHQD